MKNKLLALLSAVATVTTIWVGGYIQHILKEDWTEFPMVLTIAITVISGAVLTIYRISRI